MNASGEMDRVPAAPSTRRAEMTAKLVVLASLSLAGLALAGLLPPITSAAGMVVLVTGCLVLVVQAVIAVRVGGYRVSDDGRMCALHRPHHSGDSPKRDESSSR